MRHSSILAFKHCNIDDDDDDEDGEDQKRFLELAANFVRQLKSLTRHQNLFGCSFKCKLLLNEEMKLPH